MIGITSPSVQRRYPLATVCRLWGVSRATLYRKRSAVANEPRPPGRRGPRGIHSDADLLAAIREAIEGSPFTGEASQAVAKR
jgi:putative transposase